MLISNRRSRTYRIWSSSTGMLKYFLSCDTFLL
jgi:hypothetical protein